MKKTLFLLALTGLFSAHLSAQVTFTNEVSSKIINLWAFTNSDYNQNNCDFGGLYNESIFSYTQGKFDFGIDAKFGLDEYYNGFHTQFYLPVGENAENHWGFFWSDVDWYAEFKPVDFLGISLSRNFYVDGSYMPALGTYLSSGDFGTEGISAVVRLLDENLLLSLGLDFDDDFCQIISPDFHFGGNFVLPDIFSAGIAVRDIFHDSRQIGVFGTLELFYPMKFYFGFSWNNDPSSTRHTAGLESIDWTERSFSVREGEYYLLSSMTGSYKIGLNGKAISTVGFEYEVYRKMHISADSAICFDTSESPYDFYIGGDFNYIISSTFSVGAKGNIFVDFSPDSVCDFNEFDDYGKCKMRGLGPSFGVNPYITFEYDEHLFSVGAVLEINADPDYGFVYASFPISWKYKF